MDFYMKVLDFIVYENDFKVEIEKNFVDDYFCKRVLLGNLIGVVDNVWDVEGVLIMVGEMIRDVMGILRKLLEVFVIEVECMVL